MPSEFASTYEAEKNWQSNVEDELAEPDLLDTYFFDHPLDHLPGTFLVSQTLAIASRRTNNNYLNFSKCRFAWHEFAELTQPVLCRARANNNSFEGRLIQARTVSTFYVEWTTDLATPLTGGQTPAQLVKPQPMVVHKNLEDNIFIGNCQWNSDNKFHCCVLAPHVGHILEWKTEHVHPLFLLECCKQLLTVAGQSMLAGFSQGGPSTSFQLILKGFSLELVQPIASSAKIELQLEKYDLKKWCRNVPKAASFVIAIKVGSEVAGHLNLDSRIVEPEFFNYLRSQSK